MAKKDIKLQGNTELIVDEHKLVAEIRFSKNSDGKEWSAEDIAKVLTDAGIRYGYKEDDIAEQLKIAGEKNEGTITFKAAKGEPAVAMKAEEPQYAQLDIPESLADAIPQKLESCSPPIIQKKVVDKVKKTKTVLKKSPLPFMPAKEEQVEYTEETARVERVYVDPTVESYSYVKEGALIASLFASTPGEAGKNIFGDKVPPKSIPDPYFYCGEHCERSGNDIRATASGILRKGSNWCDVIPFSGHTWSIALSNDQATCYLRFTPGDPLIDPPEYKEIISAIEELPYPLDTIMPEGEICALIQTSIEQGFPLYNKAISNSLDAKFEIDVDEDGLKAVLNVRKGRGDGRPLVLKEVGSAINRLKLQIPDKATLKKDILDFYNSPEIELRDYIITEGRPPKQGGDQPVEWSARFIDEKEFLDLKREIDDQRELIQQNEDGSIFPLDAIDALAYVENEQRIVTFGTAQKGEPGMNVYGNPIDGLMGTTYNFVLAGSVEQKDNMIIATRAGLLERAIVEQSIYLRIRPRRDSRISIEISEDRLQAFLSIDPGEGSGAKLSEKEIRDSIEAAGVVRGILEADLSAIIERVLNGDKVEHELFAKGKAAQGGDNESLEFLLNVSSGGNVTIRNDGRADFKNRDNMTRVTKDQAVARICPPEKQPVPGFDVSGKELNTDGAGKLNLSIGEVFRQELQPDQTIILFSTIDGELLYENNRLDVLAVHTVKGNVGLSTGNIKFAGTVQVAGNVESGFYIMSESDIKIKGSVDRGLLSSGGDILIQGGVKGGGKTLLRSKQNIMASFIEQSTILSVHDIKIQKSCFRSNVKCNGRLIMGDKGSIIGGVIKVKNGLVATSIGSERGVPTKIHFGQDYLVEDQVGVQEKEIKKMQLQVAEVDAAIQKAKSGQQTASLRELANQKTKLMKLIQKRSVHLFNLKERFEQHFDSELIVNGEIYPGVVLESHGRELEVNRLYKQVTISFDTTSGRISIQERSAATP